MNPLLEAPWVKTRIFRRDWLHCSDQGVAADFLGNEFQHMQWKYPQATKKARYAAIFQGIEQFYEDEHVEDRMDCLLETFVEKDNGYKLKCSAAQCRALVPFGYMLAEELCDRSDPVEEAIYFAAFHLDEVYKTLSSDCQEPHKKKSEHGIKLALQYVAVHGRSNLNCTCSCMPVQMMIYHPKHASATEVQVEAEGGALISLWAHHPCAASSTLAAYQSLLCSLTWHNSCCGKPS